MDSLTKTNIWKKVSKQAEKIKNEVRQKKTTKDRKTPEPPISFQTEEDEGIYEDLPGAETTNHWRYEETEYSFAASEREDPASSSSQYRTSTWGSTQKEVTRLGLPRTVALKNEIQDFHRKAASLGREVPGFSGVRITGKTAARSWQDMTSLQGTQQQQWQHETAHYSEKQEVDNVLYQPFGGSLSSSVTSDDGFQSGGMHFDEAEAYYSSAAPPSKSWQLPSRNNMPNRIPDNSNSPSAMSCPSSPLCRNTRPTTNPPYVHSSSLSLPRANSGNDHSRVAAAHLDDEPIFGTIEKSHVAMVRCGDTMRYEENHDDDSVYSETPNVYDFE